MKKECSYFKLFNNFSMKEYMQIVFDSAQMYNLQCLFFTMWRLRKNNVHSKYFRTFFTELNVNLSLYLHLTMYKYICKNFLVCSCTHFEVYFVAVHILAFFNAHRHQIGKLSGFYSLFYFIIAGLLTFLIIFSHSSSK